MAGGKHVLGEQSKRYIFGTVKVGEKGQIVIPKEARELFGIEAGDTLLVLGDARTGVVISRPEVVNGVAMQVFRNLEKEKSDGNGNL